MPVELLPGENRLADSEPRALSPERLAALPHPHNPYFFGRDPLLQEINERLNGSSATAPTPASVLVLTGVDGVGKTTLAREYAEQFGQQYHDILWVPADQTLPLEFQRLACELGVIRELSRDPEPDARRALRELNRPTLRLLVFDNARDEGSIRAWLPTSGGCQTLITATSSSWPTAVPALDVPLFTPALAREYLMGRGDLEQTQANLRAADQLAAALGYLPLALELAAAFVHALGIDFDQYLPLYKQSRRELATQCHHAATRYPEAVASTCRTTLGRLGPLGQVLLRLIAFLAPDHIPIGLPGEAGELLRGGLEEILAASAAHDIEVTPQALRQALDELADYAMITLHVGMFSVHRLVQAVLGDTLDAPARRFSKRIGVSPMRQPALRQR